LHCAHTCAVFAHVSRLPHRFRFLPLCCCLAWFALLRRISDTGSFTVLVLFFFFCHFRVSLLVLRTHLHAPHTFGLHGSSRLFCTSHAHFLTHTFYTALCTHTTPFTRTTHARTHFSFAGAHLLWFVYAFAFCACTYGSHYLAVRAFRLHANVTRLILPRLVARCAVWLPFATAPHFRYTRTPRNLLPHAFTRTALHNSFLSHSLLLRLLRFIVTGLTLCSFAPFIVFIFCTTRIFGLRCGLVWFAHIFFF